MKLVTGHGGRACLVTYSLLHGVTASAIRQQTGHANLQSMLPYDRISLAAEKVLQDCLAGKERAVKDTLLMKGRSPPESPTKLIARTNKKKREGGPSKTVVGVNTSTEREVVTIDDDDEEDKKMRPIKVQDGADHDVVMAPSSGSNSFSTDEVLKALSLQKKENEELRAKMDEVLVYHRQQAIAMAQVPPPSAPPAAHMPPPNFVSPSSQGVPLQQPGNGWHQYPPSHPNVTPNGPYGPTGSSQPFAMQGESGFPFHAGAHHPYGTDISRHRMNQAQIYAGGAPGVYPQQGSVVGGGRNGHSLGTEADDRANDEKANGRYSFTLCVIS